jgi:four helix bundle protein
VTPEGVEAAREVPSRVVRERKESHMLRIYPVLLELVRFVAPLVRELERRDPDLARQCRRALTSAPLNVAEGSYSRGRNRGARYQTALGSLREALACFETAAALGYLPEVEPALRRRFDHVLGTLVNAARLTGRA